MRPAVPPRNAPDGTVPAWALWPLRLFLGVTFTYAGLQKLANPSYLDSHSPTSVSATILALRYQSPIGWLLGISAHAPVLVGLLIALGELAVGLATLLGLWVRLAAAGGLLLSLTFFLTVSFHSRPYYYGSDIVFVFAWTVPLLAAAWPWPTVDGWVRRQSAADVDPQRRRLVVGTVAAGALAVFTGTLAGATAAIGRALHKSQPPPRADVGPPSSVAPSHRSSTSASPQPSARGRVIARAAGVPAGQAIRFTDDTGAPAWLVHERGGTFRAFSAVCTHAGCTVGISGGEFVCPCHSGRYDVQTGAVLGGPPPRPLPELRVQVVDGNVRLL